jgi:hypothetical protein
MPTGEVSVKLNNELHDATGRLVGLTDRPYPPNGRTLTFKDVLVKGDLSGTLEYNGVKLRIVRVNTVIGLEVTTDGARGPVWKDVEAEVID